VIKQLVCEIDSASRTRAVIKDEWSCMTPASICLCGRDRFNFTFTYLLMMQAQMVTALKLLLYSALTAAHVCSLYPASYRWLV
jgi:hypothetical protein